MNNERGMAMLVVLFIVVVMVAIVVEFDYGTRAALTSAGTFRDGVQATYLAKSGVRAAQAILEVDVRDGEPYDATTEVWAMPIPPYALGNGFVSGQITDESSKLNVNLLALKSSEYNETWQKIWYRLFETLGIDPGVVDAIKDWLDADDFSTGSYGAESDYYAQLIPGYACKNGSMNSISELRLVRGITGEVYQKLTTGCGGKPCVTVADTYQINVNTVSLEVCQALHEDLSRELCEELLRHREEKPIESTGGNDNFPPGWGGVGGIRDKLVTAKNDNPFTGKMISGGLISVRSEYFSIMALGEVSETRRLVEALVKRQGEHTQVLSWRQE